MFDHPKTSSSISQIIRNKENLKATETNPLLKYFLKSDKPLLKTISVSTFTISILYTTRSVIAIKKNKTLYKFK